MPKSLDALEYRIDHVSFVSEDNIVVGIDVTTTVNYADVASVSEQIRIIFDDVQLANVQNLYKALIGYLTAYYIEGTKEPTDDPTSRTIDEWHPSADVIAERAIEPVVEPVADAIIP